MKEFIEANKDLISQIAQNYNVNASIHPEDHIFQFLVTNPVFPSKKEAIDYYFKDGRKSAETLLDLTTSFYPPVDTPIKLLEFASGYGCVTRHLLNLQTNLRITACDIHEEAITFLERTLHTSSILSHPEPEQIKLSSTYNIVFGLSFFLICLIQLGFVGFRHCITQFPLAAYSFSQLMDIKVKSTSAFPL